MRHVVHVREQAVQLHFAQAQHALVRGHVARHGDAAGAGPGRGGGLPAGAPGSVRPRRGA